MRYILLIAVILLGCNQSQTKRIYDYTPQEQNLYNSVMRNFNFQIDSAINPIGKKMLEDSAKQWCQYFLTDSIKYINGWTAMVTDIGATDSVSYIVLNGFLNGPIFKAQIPKADTLNNQLRNIPKSGWVVFWGRVDTVYDYSMYNNTVIPISSFTLDSVRFVEK